MFKRILYGIAALLMLITSIGFTVSVHYCGYRPVDVAVNSEPESCCDGPCNCCHNESAFVHLEEDFTSPMIVSQSPPEPIEIIVHDLMDIGALLFSFEHIESDAPPEYPPSPKLPYILSFIQVFLC